MAGLTREGLTIKKQGEVIEDLKEQAVPIFQDLVPEGDVLDTSDDSTLGRLIGLYSIPLADLWQAVQEVYWAFDPNSAEGVALDNVVALGGLERLSATKSQVTLMVWGSEGTTIFPMENVVRSNKGNLFDIVDSVTLSKERNSGARWGLEAVEEGKTYSVTIITSNTSYTASYTADSEDSEEDVVAQLASQFSSINSLESSTEGSELEVITKDAFDYIEVGQNNLTLLLLRGRTEAMAQEYGRIEQDSHSVNQIATPLLGWSSVDNPFPARVGRDRETDEELRERFRNSKFIRSQNLSDSLYSSMMNLDGVEYTAVYENTGDTYLSEYDLPPHSFRVIVGGGVAEDIAKVVWVNTPLGISSVGNELVELRDSQGFTQEVFYDRPVPQQVFITINLTTNSNFPANGADLIRQHLINWFRDNLSIGQDVVFSRLYTPINNIGGHQVDSLYLGLSPNPTGTGNIPIGYNEVAVLESANITINV